MVKHQVVRDSNNKLNLASCFKPKSIAVIGASQNPQRIGGRPIDYLKRFGYKGKVFPVNPKYSEVGGLTCYSNLSSIPQQVDMAIICVPAAVVQASVEECAAKGVKSAVVFSSGFTETGPEGRKLQDRIAEVGCFSGMAILGPNCQGLVNLHDCVFATFSSGFDLSPSQMKAGTVGFVSQSGALGGMLFPMALEMGVGFSYWVTTGNEAGMQFPDCVSYMAQDSNTEVIAGYIEAIRNGNRLKKAARLALDKKKPLIVTKCGRSNAGARAALSHTGAMTGGDEVYETAFKQMGIIRANDTQELLDYMYIFGLGKRIRGSHIAILSLSGGAGVLMADMCAERGLEVSSLSPEMTDGLKARLPAFGSASNPIDVTGQIVGDPALIGDCLRLLVNDPAVDGILILFGMITRFISRFVSDVTEVAHGTDKPVVVTWMSVGSREATEALHQNGIPAFDDPRRSVNAMHALVRYQRILDRASKRGSKGGPAIHNRNDAISLRQHLLARKSQEAGRLTEYEAKCLLDTFGIPVAQGKLTHSAHEAVHVANQIGYPVVLKVQSPQILHKTEVGGLKLNLQTAEEVQAAFTEVLTNCRRARSGVEIHGVLVEEMLSMGTEVIVGMSQDSVFGPVIAFGLGGVFVEILNDVSRRLAPLSRYDAEEMIAEVKGYKILQGTRGRPPADVQAIVDTILRISTLSMQLGDTVAELDINPLVVRQVGEGATVADALIVLK